MQTYRTVPIAECGEPLVPIPTAPFAFTEPHAYVAFGAPYGGASPWMLRRTVLDALLRAAAFLDARRPGWKLKLFDAWRPLPVQAFMVWREFRNQAAQMGVSLDAFRDHEDLARKEPALYERLAATVFMFWGVPSDDPRTPPPHSTGAAVDLTLEDEAGNEVDMGCPIDEATERAWPNYYAEAADPELRAIHDARQLLDAAMVSAGFVRHGNEWWHFSLGDQMAALAKAEPCAIYGAATMPGAPAASAPSAA